METQFSYCVAIRTLGKAGEKYLQELNSLVNQTVPPKRIFVYIAEGYDLPRETIGVEEYIYVSKGMVAQRALPFDEVETDYILLLDDDVYLPPKAVERLFMALEKENADCIAADTFKNQDMTLKSKIQAFITSLAYPRKDDEWAFKIQRNASFSYNNSPKCEVYLSQSAAGPVSLWKLTSLKKIHFQDELWLDAFPFAYGDDLLFFYKLYINGGKLLVHYNTGTIHLDGGSASLVYKKNIKRLYYRSLLWFVLWWRICYNRNDLNVYNKFRAILSFGLKIMWGMGVHLVFSVVSISYKPVFYFIKGNIEGYCFVHSEEFKHLPNFYNKRS